MSSKHVETLTKASGPAFVFISRQRNVHTYPHFGGIGYTQCFCLFPAALAGAIFKLVRYRSAPRLKVAVDPFPDPGDPNTSAVLLIRVEFTR